MGLYIRAHGLTSARMSASIIMAYLLVCLCLAAVSAFQPKIAYRTCAACLAIAVICALSLVNVDKAIVRYNYGRYKKGELIYNVVILDIRYIDAETTYEF